MAKTDNVRRGERQTLMETALRRWRRREHERPNEIIAAALDKFAEKGFAAARLRGRGTACGNREGQDLPALGE
jgi:hypothetical protein